MGRKHQHAVSYYACTNSNFWDRSKASQTLGYERGDYVVYLYIVLGQRTCDRRETAPSEGLYTRVFMCRNPLCRSPGQLSYVALRITFSGPEA